LIGGLLKTTHLDLEACLILLAVSLLPFVTLEVVKALKYRARDRRVNQG
jgi:hypothetical protein